MDLSCNLTNVKSGGITGDGGTTLPTNWQLIDGYLIGPGADLTGMFLTYNNLDGAYLSGANLTGANLGVTTLIGATLTGAPERYNSDRCDLTNATLTNATLSSAT